MSRFSRTAPAAPRPQSVRDFVDAPVLKSTADMAAKASLDTNTSIARPADSSAVAESDGANPKVQHLSSARPWEHFSRKATSKNLFNLRLNDYYLSILRHLAEQDEDRSMQRIVKEILLPELERRVEM